MTRTAFITGATAGIGQAAVKAFTGAGWRCVALGRRVDRLEALKAETGADKVHIISADVRDEATLDAAIEALPSEFAGIDLLINNAGLALGRAPAQKADLDQWRTMIDTNVTALATLTHRLLPTLIERKGAIINISSVAANNAYPGGNVYGGTKAFVSQFTAGLRSDLHGTGVRVTSVSPGAVETEFTLVRTGGDSQAHDALYTGIQPLSGEDIARTMLWVAEQPPHMDVSVLELLPVTQSLPGFHFARNS